MLHRDEAFKIWVQFGDVPVNDDDEIEIEFMGFPAGTDKIEIWQWLEEECPALPAHEAIYERKTLLG